MIIPNSHLYDPSLVCNAGQLMLDGRNISKYADQEINLVVYNCKRGLDTNQSLACCLKCPSRDRNVFSVSKGIRLLHPRILSSLHFCGGAASSLSESDALIGPRARVSDCAARLVIAMNGVIRGLPFMTSTRHVFSFPTPSQQMQEKPASQSPNLGHFRT